MMLVIQVVSCGRYAVSYHIAGWNRLRICEPPSSRLVVSSIFFVLPDHRCQSLKSLPC